MATLLSSTNDDYNFAGMKRGTVRLSNGDSISVMVGDASGGAYPIRIYRISGADRANKTIVLQQTYSLSQTSFYLTAVSMTIDNADNICIALGGQTTNVAPGQGVLGSTAIGVVKYLTFAVSGATYSAGVLATVQASGVGIIHQIDIDHAGAGGLPVIITSYEQTDSTTTSNALIISTRRTSDGTWNSSQIHNSVVDSGRNTAFKQFSVSVAFDSRGVGIRGAGIVYLTVTSSCYTSNTDAVLLVGYVTVATGIVTFLTTNQLLASSQTTTADYYNFSMDNGKFIVGAYSVLSNGIVNFSAGVYGLGSAADASLASMLVAPTRPTVSGAAYPVTNVNNKFRSSSRGLEVVGRLRPGTVSTYDWTLGIYYYFNDGSTYSELEGMYYRIPSEVFSAGVTPSWIGYTGPGVSKKPWQFPAPNSSWAPLAYNNFWVSCGGNRNNSAANAKVDVVFYTTLNGSVFHMYYQSNVTLTNPHTTDYSASISPSAGSTVNRNDPSVILGWYESVNAGTLSVFAQTGLQAAWKFSTDAGQTTGIRYVFDPTSTSNQLSGPISYNINFGSSPPAGFLFQGTWYVTGMFLDVYFVDLQINFGSFASGGTAYGSPNSFVDTHPPTEIGQSPSGYIASQASTQQTVSFQYNNTSSDSKIGSYRVTIERDDTGVSIFASGVIPLSDPGGPGTYYTVTLPAGSQPVAQKDMPLRFKVSTTDAEGVIGPYSNPVIYSFGDVPTIAITSPLSGSTPNNPSPTVNWTYASSGGRAQKNYRVIFSDTASGAVLYDTGVVASAATSFAPPGIVFANNEYGTVTLIVNDTQNLTNTTSSAFQIVFAPPASPAFSVDISQYDTSGYNLISWSDSSRDSTFNSYRVYRRDITYTGAYGPWILLYEMSGLTGFSYRDYSAPANNLTQYEVAQSALKFGVIVESTYTPQTYSCVGTVYWLIPLDVNTNPNAILFPLVNVKDDGYTDNFEMGDLELINRGRKRDYGTHFGIAGSMTAQLYDLYGGGMSARQQKQYIEAIKAKEVAYYLRTPFGDIYQVALGDVQISRVAGVGVREFCTAAIPYLAVV